MLISNVLHILGCWYSCIRHVSPRNHSTERRPFTWPRSSRTVSANHSQDNTPQENASEGTPCGTNGLVCFEKGV